MGALKSKKCSRGHLMKEPNLYFRRDGFRECKKCKNIRQQLLRKAAKKLRPAKPRKKATIKQRIVKVASTIVDAIGGDL